MLLQPIEVDFAVVPIENAIEGSVNLTLDYLIHKQRLADYWWIDRSDCSTFSRSS